jgi:hypothetical protein
MQNHDITHDILELTFWVGLQAGPHMSLEGCCSGSISMVSSHLLVAESMKSILKEKVMLRGGCNNAAYAIKCSC